jgi:hypothetical protein
VGAPLDWAIELVPVPYPVGGRYQTLFGGKFRRLRGGRSRDQDQQPRRRSARMIGPRAQPLGSIAPISKSIVQPLVARPCHGTMCTDAWDGKSFDSPHPFAIGNDATSGLVLVVFVVAAPPGASFVTPLGRAVEPLVHAPEAIHAA